MKLICPSCAACFDLSAAVNDQSARQLMKLIAELPQELSAPLINYLSFFRSRTRALAWERALRLCKEVLSLLDNQMQLADGLATANQALREKQVNTEWRPLSNHNYLKRVLEATPEPMQHMSRTNYTPQASSKTGLSLLALEGLKRE